MERIMHLKPIFLAAYLLLFIHPAYANDHDNFNKSRFLEGYIHAWNQHAPDAAVASFSDDAKYYNSIIKETRNAKEAIYDVITGASIISADFHIEIIGNPVLSDHSLAFEWLVKGLPPLSDQQQREIRGMSIVRFINNKVVYIADYYHDSPQK